MNIFERIYCRTVQFFFRAAMPFLPYREPKRLESVEEIPALLKSLKVSAVLLVTDGTMIRTQTSKRLLVHLADCGIRCTVYDGVNPNPTVRNVEAALKIYRDCGGRIA